MNNNFHDKSENIDYKQDKLKMFRSYLYQCIKDSPLNKNDQEDKKTEIQDLIAGFGKDAFTGKMFYSALISIGENIDVACEELFYDYEFPGIEISTIEMNRFSLFVSGICLNDSDIASAIGSSSSRISRIRNNSDETDFYPFQVYALAKICNIKPSQLFEYFYGEGERPIIGLVSPVEEKK